MIKKKLITSFALGVCLMTLTTGGVVLAAETNQGEVVQQELVQHDEELVKRQNEVDHYLFKDHIDDIGAQGITVTSVGIIKDQIEIGITPFTEEAANYLYEKLGKDSIQVVEGMVAELYTTTVADAPDTGVSGGTSEGYVGEGVVLEEGQMGITSFDENTLDTSVSVDKSGEDTSDGRVYKGGEVAGGLGSTEEVLETAYDPIIAESSLTVNDVKEGKTSNLLIALVAGGATILLGGIGFFIRKLRLNK